MLTILLTTVLVALGLGVILWIFTLWAQSYIYDSPADGLAWRAWLRSRRWAASKSNIN